MIAIYKLGGDHKKDGVEYSFRAISANDLDSYLADGWHHNFDDILIEEAEYTTVEVKPKPKKAAKDGNSK